MRQDRKNAGVIIAVAVVLAVVTFMNTLLVFRMTSQQTQDSGAYQLASISGSMESMISESQALTMRLGIQASPFLDDYDALEKFVYEKKDELLEETNGNLFSFYIAGDGWDIMPEFTDRPAGYVPTERDWYTGAIRNGGNTYITSPYIDARTGDICYTISVMLSDRSSVLAVDCTMDTIRDYIRRMYEKGMRNAVIVTNEGIIAGCTDDSLVGENIADVLPDYSGIYGLAKGSSDVVTSRIRSGVHSETLFAKRASSGWYMIVGVGNWELYKNSYLQLAAMITLNLGLFLVILLLYMSSLKNRKKAEDALASKEEFLSKITGELRDPLRRITDSASVENVRHSADYEEEFIKIREASARLSEAIGQIISYTNIVQINAPVKNKKQNSLGGRINARFRAIIIGVLLFVMAFSLYTNISVALHWGGSRMRSEVDSYEYRLSEWVNTQKSILDMFCSVISTHPEMLEDYEGTIEYLNRITQQYPEISATYMANPQLDPCVYMNTGWRPEANWRVEERSWYIDTLSSKEGWSISAPYYDEQTGLYCVTASEQVYDARTGEWLGIFGIDFYMDKLIDILGSSYSEKGYAFLTDANGEIINHPYGSYQMSESRTSNVSELAYAQVVPDGRVEVIRDYDGSSRVMIASRNEATHFTVYVVSSIWKIYGNVLVYGVISLMAFLICIIMVHRLLTAQIRWQEEVNRKLKESADTAIAAGNAKSQFLAQMSHEIRTPINAVLGMNEMILRESEDDSIREYSANIQSAGRTLLSLINSILDFSKIEDGKMEIIPVEYDTASMINDLVNAVSERARAKGLALNVSVDSEIPSKLFGDDVRLRQVVVNLLTNGVKYTETGSVTLSLRCEERNAERIRLYVEVKDTGIGIREEDKDKLFESFQRLDEKRNRNIEGTGLGMSIVTRLLEMMGSSLQVESVYGEGSTFSFCIYQGIVDAEPIGDYEAHLSGAAQQKTETVHLYAPSARVLVVDDNDMNLKVIRSLMKANGIVPDTASSGEEALKLVRQNRYHVIFMDHMMPKMDGIETLAAMRREDMLPKDTVVVALTANAIVGARETYINAGFADYLTKPIEIANLEKTLGLYLPAELQSLRTQTAKAGKDTKEEAGEAGRADGGGTDPDSFTMDEMRRFHEICPAIDLLSGLTYCMDSKELYLETLEIFTGEDQRERLESLFEQEDWENYRIRVHSLKSTSKTIGAAVFSEHARSMEMALKDQEPDYVRSHHRELMSEYGELLEMIMNTRGDNSDE